MTTPPDPLLQLWPQADFTPMERELLLYLLAASGRTVPREELLESVWGYSTRSKTRTVQSTVQRVRLKIEPDPARPQFLLSLRGRGYRLQPPGAQALATSVAASREQIEQRITDWLGADQDWVTLVSRRERKTNVGADSDVFMGRDAEVRALCQRLVSGTRLITLHGGAGLGKTRLSREVGRGSLDAHAGGVWFCALADARTDDEMLSVVARTLGLVIAPVDERPICDQLVQLLSVRGPTLVILDNAEQLDEAATRAIKRLHDEVGHLHVLVTSRRRLGLASEFVHGVDPLQALDAAGLLRARAEAAGVPAEALSNRAQLTQLVDLLEGVPLAVQMAAASLRMMGLAELIARLNQGLGGLRLSGSDVPARQATLRGAIEWSWQLLSHGERTALIQMAVFRGGASLELTEQIVQTDAEVLVIVASLLDKSMLRRTHHLGRNRLALFESVREFALEQADVGLNGARNRHAEWATRFAQHAYARRRVDPSVVEELEEQVDNLTEATRWLLARRSHRALDVVEGLYPLYRARFTPLEYPQLLREVRSVLALSPRDSARLSVLIGWVLDLSHRPHEALAEAESGLERLGPSDCLRGELTAIAMASEVGMQRTVDAVKRGLAVLPDARQHGWRDEQVILLNAIGSAMHLAHRTDDGMAYMNQGLQLAAEDRSDGLEMTVRTNLGGHLASRGRHEEALLQFARAESIAERFGDLAGLQLIRSNVAVAFGLLGRIQAADQLFSRVLESEERFGGRAVPHVRRANAAYSALLVGDYARAKRTLVDLLERMRRDGAGPVGFARVSAYLMIALSALGEVQAAEDLVPTVQAAAFGPKSMESELYVAHVVVARAKRSGHGSDAESLQPVQELLARVGTQQTKLGTAVTLLRTVLDGLDE